MTRTSAAPIDVTPQGGLEEGRIHGVLGYQLAQATILTTGIFLRVVGKPLELRPVEFTILQLVRENSPVTATKVAKALAVTTPGVTIWLDRLEQRGLLKRERNQTDRRTQNLKVTRKGGDLVASALARLVEAERELLKHLSEGERHLVFELLTKISRAPGR